MTFLHPTSDGLPNEAELQKMDPIEDQLAKFIADNQSGKFACIQTSGGQRKFLFYVRSESAAHQAQSALKVPRPYKVDLTTIKDPRWSLYTTLRHELEHSK